MNKADQSKLKLTQAMVKLLGEKPFTDITIQDIVAVAGVSRMAFYRNYQTKDEIVTAYVHQRFAEFEWEDGGDFRYQIFKFFWQNRDVIDLLYMARLQMKIVNFILSKFDYKVSDPAPAAYSKAFVAYTIFGLCDEWYRRGMKEDPQQIMQILKQVDAESKVER